MKLFSTMKKMGLAISLYALAINAMASEDKIPCPSPNLVKQTWMLLDTVTIAKPTKYVVWETLSTMQDPEHRPWSIVTYADANNMNEALTSGQEIVKNTFEAKQKYAIDMNDEQAMCTYSTNPNTKFGVGLIFDKRRVNSNFKLIQLDLNKLINN